MEDSSFLKLMDGAYADIMRRENFEVFTTEFHTAIEK